MSDPLAGVRWLRKVIEGDKAAAERISAQIWTAEESLGDWSVDDSDGDAIASYTHAYAEGAIPLDEYDANHIALHDPRDVIADCEAKLKILDALLELSHGGDSFVIDPFYDLLASAYRHRDGYAEHWVSTAAQPL